MFDFAKSRLYNEEDVQDAVQSAIIIAYLNIQKLRKNVNFKTWITRILINECNKIHNYNKKEKEIVTKYLSDIKMYNDENEKMNFESIIKALNDTEKKIFELYYKENLNIKQISKLLHIKENTIKTSLSRGRNKIRRLITKGMFFALILCMLCATSVIAVSMINYIKSLFNTSSVGVDNEGILNAIENLEWYQEINTEYKYLDEGYEIKPEYVILDETNLYMIFNIRGKESIDKYTDISLVDLKITNENEEIICDKKNMNTNQYAKLLGSKLIEKNEYNIKFLIYMYAENMPNSKKLNIDFSRIILTERRIFNINEKAINTNINFKIDLNEKFINRDYVTYKANNTLISKATVSATGFYAIAEETENIDIQKEKITLIDENNNKYRCNILPMSNIETKKYIIISNLNNTTNNKLKLIISNKEIELKK